MTEIEFKPIDLNSHSELCVRFRADSFFCSFNSDLKFWERAGIQGEKYLEFLRPGGHLEGFHVWESGQIIGQLEFSIKNLESNQGHINLYYLINEKRGQGYGKLLDTFSMNYLKAKGLKKSTLTVSPTNIAAINFYIKMGWKNLGQNPDEARDSSTGMSVLYMEREL